MVALAKNGLLYKNTVKSHLSQLAMKLTARQQEILDFIKNNLEMLGARFDGDWLLALAGYNSGENRVDRRVKRNLAKGKPGDFWSIDLPKETRSYVPKLLGLACLFRDPAKYDYKLPFAANKAVIAAVDMDSQSDLVLISKGASVKGAPFFVMQ